MSDGPNWKEVGESYPSCERLLVRDGIDGPVAVEADQVTIIGDGTAGAPLTVADPLPLSGPQGTRLILKSTTPGNPSAELRWVDAADAVRMGMSANGPDGFYVFDYLNNDYMLRHRPNGSSFFAFGADGNAGGFQYDNATGLLEFFTADAVRIRVSAAGLMTALAGLVVTGPITGVGNPVSLKTSAAVPNVAIEAAEEILPGIPGAQMVMTTAAGDKASNSVAFLGPGTTVEADCFANTALGTYAGCYGSVTPAVAGQCAAGVYAGTAGELAITDNGVGGREILLRGAPGLVCQISVGKVDDTVRVQGSAIDLGGDTGATSVRSGPVAGAHTKLEIDGTVGGDPNVAESALTSTNATGEAAKAYAYAVPGFVGAGIQVMAGGPFVEANTAGIDINPRAGGTVFVGFGAGAKIAAFTGTGATQAADPGAADGSLGSATAVVNALRTILRNLGFVA
jgi:hypothetical protein